MAIHYNLTLLNNKMSNDRGTLLSEIEIFVKDLPLVFKEIKQLITEKDKIKLLEKIAYLDEKLTDFGVLHAHQDGEDLLNWAKGKGKKKEALTLLNNLFENYKLAKKEIKKDYLIVK